MPPYNITPIRWCLDLIVDWSIIVSCFWGFNWIMTSGCLYLSFPLLPLILLIIGTRQHALAILGHDAAHWLAFKSRYLNTWIAEFFITWPLFVELRSGYRPWHFEHHQTLGTRRDPELLYRTRPPYSKIPVTFNRICALFFADMIGLGILDLLRFLKETFPKENPAAYFLPLAYWTTVFVTCKVLDVTWVPALWIGSLITGFWAVFRVRTWTEHIGISDRGKRSTHRFHAGPLLQCIFFPHNTFYHFEHHCHSQIPYYRLPELRKILKDEPIIPGRELLWNFRNYDERVGFKFRTASQQPKKSAPQMTENATASARQKAS